MVLSSDSLPLSVVGSDGRSREDEAASERLRGPLCLPLRRLGIDLALDLGLCHRLSFISSSLDPLSELMFADFSFLLSGISSGSLSSGLGLL